MMFLRRDLTRRDLRQLLFRGLSVTRGNYRAMLKLFGMPEADYKRFMNFLAAHDCVVDFRPFRVEAVSGILPPQSEPGPPLAFDHRASADRHATPVGPGPGYKPPLVEAPCAWAEPVQEGARGHAID